MFGNRAIYHEGWLACTKVIRPPWVQASRPTRTSENYPSELYDLTRDCTQSTTSRRKHPEKLKEMQETVHGRRREKYQVLPLDDS